MLALNDIELKQTRFYQEIAEEEHQLGRQEGRQEGRQQECISLVTRLLRRKFGIHTALDAAQGQLPTLPIEKLEDLAEAMFDWADVNELTEWLKNS